MELWSASPRQIALSCGEVAEPIYKRFIDTCGSYHYLRREQFENYVIVFILFLKLIKLLMYSELTNILFISNNNYLQNFS